MSLSMFQFGVTRVQVDGLVHLQLAVENGHVSCCRMNALKLAAIFLVVCVALAPLIDALEAEDEEVMCHKFTSYIRSRKKRHLYFNCSLMY